MSSTPPNPDGSDPNEDLPGYGTMPSANQPKQPNQPGAETPSEPNPVPPGGFQPQQGGYQQPPQPGGYQQPPQPGGYQQPWAPTPQTANQSALWSMILGIVSIPLMCLCSIGAVPGIAAIVLGIIAKRQITQSSVMQPGAPQTGAGQALAGIICGSVALAFSLLYLVFFGIGMIAGL